ncbi:YtzI protein [Pseudalkalibacillus sp. R45]|uniref:YtzI protein n=1 Tax=Pseudalkalibacillus sp. R45 TaxID=3457433 RepID=UPI003FCC90FC
MFKVLLVSILIIIVVLVLFVAAISKGYSYKHTIDPLENNPNIDEKEEDEEKPNR